MSLLGAIQNLESAVFYKDCRGRYASLPNNNSMRIDLLSGRISYLTKLLEDNLGKGDTENIKKIVNYLTGESVSDFPATYDGQVIHTEDGKGDYSTIRDAIQSLYNDVHANQVNSTTNIQLSDNDPYMTGKIQSDITPEQYQREMKYYPSVFQYLYDMAVYACDRLPEYTDDFDVFEGMTM